MCMYMQALGAPVYVYVYVYAHVYLNVIGIRMCRRFL